MIFLLKKGSLSKKQKKEFFMSIFVFAGIILTLVGIFANQQFEKNEVLDYLPESLPRIFFIWFKWSFPFYFTIQTNFLIFLYFFLKSLGLMNPVKSKKSHYFELIVIANSWMTFLVYWSFLSWFDSFDNSFYLIQNFMIHFFSPLLIIIYWLREIRLNKRPPINKKNFWIFLVYPICYLIMAIIIYYSTRDVYKIYTTYEFTNSELAYSFSIDPFFKNFVEEVDGTKVTWSQKTLTANSLYPFLSFDWMPWWLPTFSVLIIAFLFGVFGLGLILLQNKKR